MKKHIQLMSKVLSFLDRLSEEQLDGLISGKIRLKISDASTGGKKAAKPQDNHDWDEIANKLDSQQSREQAKEYIQGLALNKTQLLDLLRKYSITGEDSSNCARLIDTLVEATVGAKLKHEALLNLKND